MSRARDIGWQHGKMIEGHRHHVQCNYCHRIMIGGVTRFKKHLASRRGEIKGCEAVPPEVKDLIEKHLVAWETRKMTEKKRKVVYAEPLNELSYYEKGVESSESYQDIVPAKLESLRNSQEAEEGRLPISNDEDHPMVLNQEMYDLYTDEQCNNEQGTAPPRATDLGWVHGIMVNGDQQKIKCKYCHKIILGGGISRLKQHLAGERGNITPCDKVPDDVRAQMHQHLDLKVSERIKKQKCSDGREEETNGDVQRNLMLASPTMNNGKSGREWDEGTSGKRRRRRQRKQVIPPSTSTCPPSSQNLALPSQESIDQADMAVAKFMYEAGIPLSAANSPYFQQIADAITAVGPGYKMPSYNSLRGDLLKNNTREVSDLCQELKKSWEVTGCSVMADKWTNRSGDTVINFYVYSSKGTVFLKSADASEISKSPETLVNLFDSVVQEVGPKNIVNFITDITPNYKTAGKMLMDKYKTFFWSACAVQCIELMLEEMSKFNEVKEGLTKAKKICQFIYNQSWVLDLMKKRTNGRDVLTPAVTRFASDFSTLQTIVSLKDSLHQMFTSTDWIDSAFSKQRSGLEVTETVLDPLFWSQCTQTSKVSKPLLSVLELACSGERPSMGFLYDAMDKAKKIIIDVFDNKESDYLPYLKVIQKIWEEELHSPLHAAAYYLNPSIFYSPNFSINKVIWKGLLDCIEGLEPNFSSQDMITKQTTFYSDAVGDFSRPVAIRGRESLAPATWWSLYATDYSDLQRLAIRILSQTCSATPYCDKKWRTFEQIHLKSKNSLERERQDELIFVHYNLQLQKRHMVGKTGRQTHDQICLEETDMEGSEWVEDPGCLNENEENLGGWLDVGIPINATTTTTTDVADTSSSKVTATETTDVFDCNYNLYELSK